MQYSHEISPHLGIIIQLIKQDESSHSLTHTTVLFFYITPSSPQRTALVSDTSFPLGLPEFNRHRNPLCDKTHSV